jgi:acetoin utilization deacetylase AcuC-like enzyme
MLSAEGLYEFHEAPLATEETLALTHDPRYVRGFLDGALPPGTMRRIGFPWSRGLVLRTLGSVGGTLAAAADALSGGLGVNLAGGTHHAFYAEGSGFCVFNDIAVAIRKLRHEGRVRRAAVVDLDVHQGDGTAALFRAEAEVLTLSVHGRNNFPFRKQQSVIDVELSDGTEDSEYLAVVGEVLPRVFEFRPEIVFYQAGVDALAEDRLGRLALSLEGLAERDRLVLAAARDAGAPIVITQGGGYAEPIELTARAHAGTFRTAAAVFNTEAR